MNLSKSAIENYRRCPRCFWLEKTQKIKTPQGIHAGVPMAIDRVLKEHYDNCRAQNILPPELQAQLPGWKLYDGKRIPMKELRYWGKGLTVKFGDVLLRTALDDLLFHPGTGRFAMIDYKSKAKKTNADDTRRYYQLQASAYDLALNVNKYPTKGEAFFAYYSPVTVEGAENTVFDEMTPTNMGWQCQVIQIGVDHEEIRRLATEAADCINGPIPEPEGGCELCNYIDDRRERVHQLQHPTAA